MCIRDSGRDEISSRDAYSLSASVDDRFSGADGRTSRVGGRVVLDGRDERLESIGVERARQHEWLIDPKVQEAFHFEQREVAIAAGLNQWRLEIRAPDPRAQH